MVEQTYNPIREESEFKLSFFQRMPVPDRKQAILLFSSTSGADMLCLTHDSTIRLGEIKRNKYNRQLTIDLTSHDVRFQNEVTCRDNISKFIVTVTATVHINDPEQAYYNQVTDVCKHVENSLLPLISERALDFYIEDSNRFRQELQNSIIVPNNLKNGIKLEMVNLYTRGDQKYESFLESQRDIDILEKLEFSRASSAENLKKLYRNPITAIFSEVARGKMDVIEAYERSKRALSEDFDERLRQIKETTNYIRSLEADEMISSADLSKNIHQLLGKLVSFNSANAIEENSSKELLESTKNKFRPFDEDDNE